MSSQVNMIQAITSIVEGFDFETMHRIMHDLDWCWAITDPEEGEYFGTPGIRELVASAIKLLAQVYQKVDEGELEYTISTGGFEASAWKEEGEIQLNLKFIAVEYGSI